MVRSLKSMFGVNVFFQSNHCLLSSDGGRYMKKTIIKTLLVYVLLALSSNAHAEVLITPPVNPGPICSYLFYLHGQIVEGSNERPISPEYGPYEYY